MADRERWQANEPAGLGTIWTQADPQAPIGAGPYELTFHRAGLGMAVVRRVHPLRWDVVEVNAMFHAITGLSHLELVGRPIAALAHPDHRGDFLAALEALTAAPGTEFEREMVWTQASGLDATVAVRACWFGDLPGAPGSGIVQVRDISRERRTEETARATMWRLRSIIETSTDAFVAMDDSGFIIDWNHQAEEVFGWTRSEALGHPFASTLMAERERESLHRGLMDFVETGELAPQYSRAELVAVHRDGHEFPVELTAWPIRDGQATSLVAFIRDITDRRAYEQQLAHQALHDSLTGLPNRALFLDRLRQALTRPRRGDRRPAVMLLDIDRFTLVNDTLGHEVADAMLRAIAERLQRVVRETTSVARVGSDEFAVLCESAADDEAQLEAARVHEALSRPFAVAGVEAAVTVSMGVVMAATEDERPESLLRDAEEAMARAKSRGRACIEVFNGTLRSQVVGRFETEKALRRALAQNELHVVYQPLIVMSDDSILGAEALIRWDRPGHGLVSPTEFIPIAEETGLIESIGAFVLDEACREAAEWTRLAGGRAVRMSVNLSARQLTRSDVVPLVTRALERAGLDPGCLCVEITESAVMEDSDSIVGGLRALRDLGVHVAIDDFGTAYSSLSYLTRFPVDNLKVDRSFVDGLGQDPQASAIVTAVIGLAHALGLSATAEGVETSAQADALRLLGCDLAQGYYYGRPSTAEDLRARWRA